MRANLRSVCGTSVIRNVFVHPVPRVVRTECRVSSKKKNCFGLGLWYVRFVPGVTLSPIRINSLHSILTYKRYLHLEGQR